jgi:hypothetical protein
VRQFDDDETRRRPADYRENLEVFEALWEHARRLGVLPLADPLDGIDTDIRRAEALSVR